MTEAEAQCPPAMHPKRVEKRGRFTITDITPGSPTTPALSPTGDHSPQPEAEEPHRNEPETPVHLPSTPGIVPNRVPLECSPRLSPKRSPSPGNSIPDMSLDGSRHSLDESSNDPRVKRKGRFTIIDLPADATPEHRGELKDGGQQSATTVPLPHNQPQPVRGANPSIPRPTSTAKPRPMSKPSMDKDRILRQHEKGKTFTSADFCRRSQSPVRDGHDAESSNNIHMNGHAPSLQHHAKKHSRHRQRASISALPTGYHHGTEGMTFSYASTASLSTEASMTAASTNGNGLTYSSPDERDSRRHNCTKSKTVTISATQYMQQQQSIAYLIRQQHELKQVIKILQDQQQQLMSIPSQLHDLRLEAAQSSNTRDEASRDLQIQLDAMMRANESMQTLLNQSEYEAQERSLEVQYLNDENEDLRRRSVMFETKYLDEREHSSNLKDEILRLRAHHQDNNAHGSHD